MSLPINRHSTSNMLLARSFMVCLLRERFAGC
jgi:hypothetical protein